jgi:hypothetical protein
MNLKSFALAACAFALASFVSPAAAVRSHVAAQRLKIGIVQMARAPDLPGNPKAQPTDAQQQGIRRTSGLDGKELARAWNYDLDLVGGEKQWSGNPRKSLLVIRRGWIAFEAYHSPDGSHNKDARVAFASGTKTLVGVAMARLFTVQQELFASPTI